MTVKRYRITWTKLEKIRKTVTEDITADDSFIDQLAQRGDFTYTAI